MKKVMSLYLDIDCQEIYFTAFLACNVLFVSNHIHVVRVVYSYTAFLACNALFVSNHIVCLVYSYICK